MAATLPKTKEYRVATLAVRYRKPELTLGPDGSEVVVSTTAVGRFGEHVELTDAEAKRLEGLGPQRRDGSRGPAVKPKDAALSYDEMNDKQLQSLIDERGITAVGSGANGEFVKDDLVNALETYDRGQTSL